MRIYSPLSFAALVLRQPLTSAIRSPSSSLALSLVVLLPAVSCRRAEPPPQVRQVFADSALANGAESRDLKPESVTAGNCLPRFDFDMSWETCQAILAVGTDSVVVPGLWVHVPLTLIGDSLFVGIASADSGRSWSLAQVDFRTRAISWLPLPSGASSEPGTFAINPDGHYVGYVEYRPDTAVGVLQTWPNLVPIARTASIAVGATDMPTAAVRFGVDSVEFYFQTEALVWHRWMRYRARLSQFRWVIDTVDLSAR